MRIALAHIRHAETGGVERFQNHLAASLAAQGHEVTLLCRRHSAPPHPEVRIRRLHGLALGKTWRIWTFARDVEREVRREDYDVVLGLGRIWSQHVMRLGSGLHGTYLALAHDAKQSLLERLSGGGWTRHRLTLAIERKAFAAPELARVVANSHMVARDAERTYGIGPERLEVLHNGVDLERFSPERPGAEVPARARLRREWGLKDELVVLFLGTGFGRKGLDLALRGFRGLRDLRPDARLVVVGRDAAPGRFQDLASELGIEDAVRFAGERTDAPDCYRAADLFLLPTRYDPFANATVEALASGLPVVTSTQNGGHEVIDPRVQGSAVTLSDGPARIAEELRYWADDEVRAAGSLAARARAEEHPIEDKMKAAERLLLDVARERAGR